MHQIYASSGASTAAAVGGSVDDSSVHVSQVDYDAKPEELQEHFSSCGTINRVTILVNKFTGKGKGFAYVEFADKEAVENALLLNDSVFKGRELKVAVKRVNTPGLKGKGKGKGGKGKGGKDHGKGGKGKGMRHCVGLMAPLFGEGHRAEARVAERLAFVEAKLQAAVSGRALPAGKAERLEHKRNILAAHLAELQDRRPKDPKDTLPKDTTKADGAEDDAGAKPTPGCEAKPECSAGSGAADRGGFCGFGRPEHHFHEHHHHYHHHEGHGKGHGGKGDGMGKGGKGKRHGGKGGFFGSGMN